MSTWLRGIIRALSVDGATTEASSGRATIGKLRGQARQEGSGTGTDRSPFPLVKGAQGVRLSHDVAGVSRPHRV